MNRPQKPETMVDDGCRGSSMLDLGVPAQIVSRAKDTENMFNSLFIFHFFVHQVGCIEVKAIELGPHAIVIKTLEKYGEDFEDCD